MQERNSQKLLRFLLDLQQSSTDIKLFLLGDIFDLWVSKHQVFRQRFLPLLQALEGLAKKGAQIYYFEGNHDLHLKEFFQDELGAKVYESFFYFTLDGCVFRCEHGDQMNLDDTAYLKLRATLRNPLVEWLGHQLPGHFWDWLGQRWSAHSRHQGEAKEISQQQIIEIIRQHAERAFQEKPFDYIISGHMHVRDEWSFLAQGKEIKSINLGTWLEVPKVLKFENQQMKWIEL